MPKKFTFLFLKGGGVGGGGRNEESIVVEIPHIASASRCRKMRPLNSDFGRNGESLSDI